MDKGYNFLHNHPMTEKSFGLDEKHVIVDRDAWEEARKRVLNLGIPLVTVRCFLTELEKETNEILAKQNETKDKTEWKYLQGKFEMMWSIGKRLGKICNER